MSPTPRADVTVEALDRVEQRTPDVTQRGLDRLEQHIKELLNERDRRYEQRFHERDERFAIRHADGQQANAAALQAVKELVSTQLLAAKEAVTKAEQANEKRFESMNEFRGQLTDQARTFIPRIEAEHRLASLDAKVDSIEKSILAITAAQRGSKDLWGYVVGGVGVILGLASFAISNFMRIPR